MELLQKWMLKSGKPTAEIAGILKSAGQRRMDDKLKVADDSGHELPVNGDMVKSAVDESSEHYGSVTKVDDDGGSAVEQAPDEFKPVGKKGKKPYL